MLFSGTEGRSSADYLGSTASLPDASMEVVRSFVRLQAVNKMLTAIYNFDAASCHRKAMLEVFRAVDGCMSTGDAATCDVLLQKIDVARLHSDTVLALLSSTFPARHELPSRKYLFEIAFAKLVNDLGDAEAHAVADRMK